MTYINIDMRYCLYWTQLDFERLVKNFGEKKEATSSNLLMTSCIVYFKCYHFHEPLVKAMEPS